jgi:hypothetical protein
MSGYHQLNVVETTDLVNDQILFQEAIRQPAWCAAMQEEFNALIANLTWELVQLPQGKKALSSHWVFKAKPKVNPPRFDLRHVSLLVD